MPDTRRSNTQGDPIRAGTEHVEVISEGGGSGDYHRLKFLFCFKVAWARDRCGDLGTRNPLTGLALEQRDHNMVLADRHAPVHLPFGVFLRMAAHEFRRHHAEVHGDAVHDLAIAARRHDGGHQQQQSREQPPRSCYACCRHDTPPRETAIGGFRPPAALPTSSNLRPMASSSRPCACASGPSVSACRYPSSCPCRSFPTYSPSCPPSRACARPSASVRPRSGCPGTCDRTSPSFGRTCRAWCRTSAARPARPCHAARDGG